MPIRVFLVSDFRLVQAGLAALLGQEAGRFQLAGTAGAFAGALQSAGAARADIILLDVDTAPDQVLAAIDGLRAAGEANILLLARQMDRALLDKAVVGGARGLIDKDTAPATLFNALEKVHEGQLWLDRAATGRIFVELARRASGRASGAAPAPAPQLTAREQEIVATIARHSGEPSKTVAGKLNISESTLRNHLSSIYDKLGVANRNGLLAYAFKNGLAENFGR